MRTLKDFQYLARDFGRVLTNTDYFRMCPPVGAYFSDPRCYYLDWRAKVAWTGHYVDGVPMLYVPPLRKHEAVPVMILHYGLGSIDGYFTEGGEQYLSNISNVSAWIANNLLPQGYCSNGIVERSPHRKYHSDNSAMAQGELLSFCTRVIRHQLVTKGLADRLEGFLSSIVTNMLLPLEQEGTTFRTDDDLYLCEFCEFCRDRDVVLNGWIFAIFGLMDYAAFRKTEAVQSALEQTLTTLDRAMHRFVMPNGWSYYNLAGRVCAPHYHDLHVNLLTALAMLTKKREVLGALEK